MIFISLMVEAYINRFGDRVYLESRDSAMMKGISYQFVCRTVDFCRV